MAKISVNVTLDLYKVGEGVFNEIARMTDERANRKTVVGMACRSAFYKFDSRYQVMVCIVDPEPRESLFGVVYQAHFRYDGQWFGVWVFEHGDFRNMGHGGDANWRFTTANGVFRYDDDGKRVGNGLNVRFPR